MSGYQRSNRKRYCILVVSKGRRREGYCIYCIATVGKYYYEAIVSDEGLCRVGWSTLDANLDLGTDKYGFGFGGTGKKSNNKQFDDYGEVTQLNIIHFIL